MSEPIEKPMFDSSSEDAASERQAEAPTANEEKTAMGLAPFPIQAEEKVPPLNRLDSEVPKSLKAPEKENEDQDPFGHLPEHEAAILKRQVETPAVKVTYFRLYQYGTRKEFAIMAVCALCAITAGAVLPLMTIIFGSLAGKFKGFFNQSVTGDEFQNTVNHLVLYFLYLGIGEFVTIYISTVGFIYTGEKIAGRIREHYLASILRQNIGYFDKLGAGEITTRITADTNLVQDGISEKVGLTLTAVATFITAYVIAYVKYWKLALIDTSAIVAISLTMGLLGGFITKYNKKSLAAYAEGGTVAEEVISSIRNATAFGTQDKLAKQYEAHLIEAEKWSFRMKAILGSMLGFLLFYIYLTYALTFWLGSKYLVSGEMGLSDSTLR